MAQRSHKLRVTQVTKGDAPKTACVTSQHPGITRRFGPGDAGDAPSGKLLTRARENTYTLYMYSICVLGLSHARISISCVTFVTQEGKP